MRSRHAGSRRKKSRSLRRVAPHRGAGPTMAETTPGPAPGAEPDAAPPSPVDALFLEHGTGDAVVNALLDAIVGGKLADEVRLCWAAPVEEAWRRWQRERRPALHSPAGKPLPCRTGRHTTFLRAAWHAPRSTACLLLPVPRAPSRRHRDASYADGHAKTTLAQQRLPCVRDTAALLQLLDRHLLARLPGALRRCGFLSLQRLGSLLVPKLCLLVFLLTATRAATCHAPPASLLLPLQRTHSCGRWTR